MNLKDLSTLQIALGLSVVAHAALLAVRFVDPEAFNRVFQDTPLEIILVNASTNETPDKAMAIAQKSMAGGGDLDRGRATSPLPPSTFSGNVAIPAPMQTPSLSCRCPLSSTPPDAFQLTYAGSGLAARNFRCSTRAS